MSMRVTIVGCGYVGEALARRWGEQAAVDLTVTTTREERRVELIPLARRVLVVRASDPTALFQALDGAQAAVFCMAPGGDRQVDADGYAATYRDSMRALQDLLPDLPQLRQIVYTSSCGVYGDAAGGWVDESTPAIPRDAHAAVLLESEQLLEQCRADQRRVCVLRLGAIYGPGRELIRRFKRLAGTTRPGDGRIHSNWIHRDDVAGAIAAAVAGGWDQTVNVVDDQPWLVADLLNQICNAADLPPVQWSGLEPGAKPMADRRISNRRLHSLGYELLHPRLLLRSE
jgi:nucleoside-diphosphate-sugar epimerase